MDDVLWYSTDTLPGTSGAPITNCSMQHAKFNQTKALWQRLEQHVLEQSVTANTFAAQVLTGPDPRSRGPVLRVQDLQSAY
ncbi:hypothetical protein HB774_34610 (plasmid) [Rhizobium leguminosarum bv. viciae]|nr:hypothetical protein HB774_34610 [Rhizobium leguminosarum bv. viciae]